MGVGAEMPNYYGSTIDRKAFLELRCKEGFTCYGSENENKSNNIDNEREPANCWEGR